jgi:hypothetical protein
MLSTGLHPKGLSALGVETALDHLALHIFFQRAIA